MITNQDGEQRAARILMPNKNILQRSLVHLYPLECHDEKPNIELNENTAIGGTVRNEVINQDTPSKRRKTTTKSSSKS